MQATSIDVLRALRGFKMAAGAPEDVATSWASAHQQEGLAAAQRAIDNDRSGDPHSSRRAVFAALKNLAQTL